MKYQDVETIALIVFAALFVLLERFSPKHASLEIRKHLKTDLLAFGVLVVSVNFSRFVASKLFQRLNVASLTLIEQAASWPLLIKLLIAHVLSDFCLYWVHRGMHSNAFLWRTHQWHHSPEALYWFSGFRTSFMHAFLYAFPQVFVGFFLFQLTPVEVGIGFSLGVLSNLFTHSNLKVPQWLPLHYVLVTPDFHHPHHSQLGTQNKNFGNVFTIWDRAFGSYVDPKKIRADFKYGLKEKPENWRMMIGL